MAKAIRNSGVTLYMSEEEANTLLTITRFIGGSPDNSRRKHVDDMRKALQDAGVEYDDSDIQDRNTVAINFVTKPSFAVGDVVEIVDSEGRTNEVLQVGEVGIVTFVKDITLIRVNPFKGGDETTDYGFFPDSLKLLRKAKG